MNKFEPVSQAEYNKVVTEEFTAKNGVIDYQSYEQLQIPKRATKGSAGYDFFSPISFNASKNSSGVLGRIVLPSASSFNAPASFQILLL